MTTARSKKPAAKKPVASKPGKAIRAKTITKRRIASKQAASKAAAPAKPATFDRDLLGRPGFLIRRLHQIHLALFAEECAAFEVTPVQYSIMTAIARQPGLEQARLAHEVGIDRATLANVVTRLESRDLINRDASDADRRLKLVKLTRRGIRLLEKMDTPARRAHERTIDALPAKERDLFLKIMRRLVDAGNEYGRAPLRLE